MVHIFDSFDARIPHYEICSLTYSPFSVILLIKQILDVYICMRTYVFGLVSIGSISVPSKPPTEEIYISTQKRQWARSSQPM